MKFAVTIFVAAFIAINSVKALPTDTLAKANSDSQMINFLMQTDSSLYNGDVSTACFAKYLPQLNEISTTFSTTYQQCQTTADTDLANLINATSKSFATFENQVSAMCTAYQTCNGETDALTFFNCYATESSKDTSVLYDLSNSATAAATTYTQDLAKIQDTEQECTKTAEQTYVTSTAATYKVLEDCLAGVTTVATSSTTAAAAPATTSPPPTTNIPITTTI